MSCLVQRGLQSRSMPGRHSSSDSLASRIAQLPAEKRRKILGSLSKEEARALQFEWGFWARPNQLLPAAGDWTTWLICSGRGWGKTRCGAEAVRALAEQRVRRITIVGRTAQAARDEMVEGESGIMAVSPPWFRPQYEPSKRRLTWPNGVVGTIRSADEPDTLRGPQHEVLWADELAAWKYDDAWDQAMFGLRLGKQPRAIVTTTPRPTKLIKALIVAASTVLSTGTTYDNRANLSKTFYDSVIGRYEGTRLGRQELLAEILDDAPGALWKRYLLDQHRVRKVPRLVRVAVGVDPAVSATEESAETGIVAAGLGEDGHGYVLEDASLEMASPGQWGAQVVSIFNIRQADKVIAEVNNGGDLVESNIKSAEGGKHVPVEKVHASRGKQVRADPVAALYERGMVHHLGSLPKLEDQMCSWDPTDPKAKSPDRVDALVANGLVGRPSGTRSSPRSGTERATLGLGPRLPSPLGSGWKYPRHRPSRAQQSLGQSRAETLSGL